MTKPTEGIIVDASVTPNNPGRCEFRGLDIKTKEILFWYAIPGLCTNNIGEFLALCKGVNLLITDKSREGQRVWSDSKTALAWYHHKAHRSTLMKDSRTEIALSQLVKAIGWLRNLKGDQWVQKTEFWSNKNWGENAADFGRK